MFRILRHYGIPAKIVRAIQTIYQNSKSTVLVEGKLSEEFDRCPTRRHFSSLPIHYRHGLHPQKR